MSDQRELTRRLMDFCDEDVDRLRGLVCAAHGLAEALFDKAEDSATLEPSHIGLKHLMGEIDSAVCKLGLRLEETHRLARGETD